jgi:hypothetical protein
MEHFYEQLIGASEEDVFLFVLEALKLIIFSPTPVGFSSTLHTLSSVMYICFNIVSPISQSLRWLTQTVTFLTSV